jgi:UDP-2-acetamido-2,6-beta-L-arabino-hexul-4-ose reductase
MNILITGYEGFIAKNLRHYLKPFQDFKIIPFRRGDTSEDLAAKIKRADAIVHLAGVNRSPSEHEFETGNAGFTKAICDEIIKSGKSTPILYASSIQAVNSSPYGKSKRNAEHALEAYHSHCRAPVTIFRLANVFGKWCRPHYNSVVATFCHNVSKGLPVTVHDPERVLQLIHVDHVVKSVVDSLCSPSNTLRYASISPEYSISVTQLLALIRSFRENRKNTTVGRFGEGLERALYSTYVSYLTSADVTMPLLNHADARGNFVEFIKTEKSGQVSFFTANPGVTRGGHYHNTKVERFLVLNGTATFRFRHIETEESFSIDVNATSPTVIESIPGWWHDVKNIGEETLIVAVWANEVFDPENPDTYSQL